MTVGFVVRSGRGADPSRRLLRRLLRVTFPSCCITRNQPPTQRYPEERPKGASRRMGSTRILTLTNQTGHKARV